MNEHRSALNELQYGGAIVYPLLFLGIIAVLIILDRAVTYYRSLRLPRSLADLVETYGFSWDETGPATGGARAGECLPAVLRR